MWPVRIASLNKMMGAIHNQIGGVMLGASDWMTQCYNVRAEKMGYMTENVEWLNTQPNIRKHGMACTKLLPGIVNELIYKICLNLFRVCM